MSDPNPPAVPPANPPAPALVPAPSASAAPPPASKIVAEGKVTEATAALAAAPVPAQKPDETERKYQERIARLEDENHRLKNPAPPVPAPAKAKKGMMEKWLAGESVD